MILSEFAGAAQSLNGSIVVNPWDSQQVANAIHEAVTMDSETRKENHRKLFKVIHTVSSYTLPERVFTGFLPQYVTKYSSSFWGTSFINEMGRLSAADSANSSNIVPSTAETTSPKSELKVSKEPENGSGIVTAIGSTADLLQLPSRATA